jgi:hypothetical protein
MHKIFLYVIILILFKGCLVLERNNVIDLDGKLVEFNDSEKVIRLNGEIINNSIKRLGTKGGGLIKLPEGTFYVGPNLSTDDAAIIIEYDDIHIIGKGRDKTILKTNGTYKIIEGKVKRGHGILINGEQWSSDCNKARKNILLKGFQLDGQSGYTGNHTFPADINTGDGWDVSHKGIITNSDRCVGDIWLEDLYIHSYKGEILFNGGLSTRNITIKNVKAGNTNASCFNLYGANMIVENCEFVGPAMMWMELTARKNLGFGPKNKTEVKNCTFNGPTMAHAGINLVQGDSDMHHYIFRHNTFKDSKGVFAFYGGIGGKVHIENNILDSVGQALYFGVAPGYIGDGINRNITFTGNNVSCYGVFTQFYHEAENVLIKNNKVSGLSEHATSAMYGACTLTNILFENNSFENMRQPEQNAPLKSGEKPTFYRNQYLSSLEKK